MARIVSIADDLTGAAEIAGIVADHGLPALLCRAGYAPDAQFAGHSVSYDTDSRSLPPAEAAARLAEQFDHLPACDLLYKKTDSALRGNIVAEVRSLMRRFWLERAVLVAQNPSKGRIIRNGIYTVAGVPIDQTDFGRDPEHPCTTADVSLLLSRPGDVVPCLPLEVPFPAEGIIAGEAVSDSDVGAWAERIDAGTLAAGGADFFRALLRKCGLRPCAPASRLPEGPSLFVCGSASEQTRRHVAAWTAQQCSVCPMPDDLFHAPESIPLAESWTATLAASFRRGQHAILTIPQRISAGHAIALRHLTAQVVASLLHANACRSIFVEGGATASAIVERMAWKSFAVSPSIAPGIVPLAPTSQPSLSLILKPGSYPWPHDVLQIPVVR